jgi:hypothetical protein
MAFLDNSGDILLDAVLTDTGRKRMAEGTFRITKFALADDEIDYSLYNYNDSRGSAYYDLDILSSPVLEAFTDNAAGLKSKLVSYGDTSLEYLPVMKLFENSGQNSKTNPNTKSFIVSVNSETDTLLSTSTQDGIINSSGISTRKVLIHQGIDNIAIPHTETLDAKLLETSYIIEMDNRISILANTVDTANANGTPAYIDDDEMASYIVSNTSGKYLENIEKSTDPTDGGSSNISSIAGSRNSRALKFKLKPALGLTANNFLFERLGGTMSSTTIGGGGSNDLYYIDINVRVMGATTGFRLDVPVRFVKKI